MRGKSLRERERLSKAIYRSLNRVDILTIEHKLKRDC